MTSSPPPWPGSPFGYNGSVQSGQTSPRSRIFLVTGATDGIGQHTARKLASDGHTVLVHGRRPEVAAELVSDLRSRGAAFALYLNADLGDLREVEKLAEEVKKHVDRIDVLINNAGVFDPSPRFSTQGYDMTWAVNVMAPFLLTGRLLPLIARGNRPRIITTSSISQSSSLPNLNDLFSREGETGQGKGGYSGHQAYSHSKLGDLMFTVKLAKLLQSQRDPRLSGIKCLTMDPGTVNTKMLLAGWGPCGISVNRADNTYKLAATNYGEKQESGTYHFGFGGMGESKDEKKLDALWAALEDHTGCRYSHVFDSIQ